jgi:hypothetical protein
VQSVEEEAPEGLPGFYFGLYPEAHGREIRSRMKIATFNVNGVNGRLPVLLRWLAEAEPDIVCLQELKAPQEKFPEPALRQAGYGAVWQGQKSWNGVAILARGTDPIATTRGLPSDPDNMHSRYIEAAVNGVLVASIYLPNGNPVAGPKIPITSCAGSTDWFRMPPSCWRSTSRSCLPAITTSCPPILTCMRRSVGARTPCSARKSGPRFIA